MPLRKSPQRSPAMLAANRANARKSTGPRTPEGKSRVALNALRHGFYARNFLSALARSRSNFEEFAGLYQALYLALAPSEEKKDNLLRTTIRVWVMKRRIARWAASPDQREAFFAQSGGRFPAPWRLRLKRPGWNVLVTIWVRRGRGRGRRRLLWKGAGWQEGRARLHVGVTVTASMKHPEFGYPRLEDVPEGMAPRVVFSTKPVSLRNDNVLQNVIPTPESEVFPPKPSPITQKTGLVAPSNVVNRWVQEFMDQWEKLREPKKEVSPQENA